MEFNRRWAMPNKETFSIYPIKKFVHQYLKQSKISIDPFARNKTWATHTNDIDPTTSAQYHLDAIEFLKYLNTLNIKADLLFIDPPYSPRQISEHYHEIGLPVGKETTQTGRLYKQVRDAAIPVLAEDAIVLSFGWNSVGMGKKRGFDIIEVLLVCHGGGHNDTICIAEKRVMGILTIKEDNDMIDL